MRDFAWDLVQDHSTARAYLDGYNPYSKEGAERANLAKFGPSGNGHPPTTSFWILPLARLDLATAKEVLGGLSILLLFGQLAALLFAIEFPAPLFSAWLWGAYLLSCPFIGYHLSVGQFSIAIAGLYSAAWLLARRGADVWAGVALGVACTLKFFPGLVVLLFLLWRRFRVVGAAVAVFLLVATVMTARFGLESWPQFFAKQPLIAAMWMENLQNQSLHGIILRLFHPSCEGPQGLNPISTAISSGLSLLLIAAAGVGAVRALRRTGRIDLSFAVFVVLSLFTSQWTWEHYNIIYALPWLLAGRELAERWRRGDKRLGLVIGGVILFCIAASWRIPHHLKRVTQVLYWRGDHTLHTRLHVLEIANWLPGVLLLGLLGVLLYLQGQDGQRPQGQGEQDAKDSRKKDSGTALIYRD